MLDFNKLRAAAVQESMDSKTPQDIFNQLTQDKYSYLRSYQSEVLTEWYNNRANQYNLIKMNTGAGKTLVGLLILLTLNHEHRGKMLYVVPDKYLETQVKKEAQKLRIEIAIDENDRAYLSGEAILIININKLVNGMSVFGVNSKNLRTADYIIFDDAHACLKIIKEQYTLTIPNTSLAYTKLFNLFENALKNDSIGTYQQIKQRDPVAYMRVPFYSWIDNIEEIIQILTEIKNEECYKFSYPLIQNQIRNCEAVISGKQITIFPMENSFTDIAAISEAKNKIFMSATFSDDTDLVIGLDLQNNISTLDIIAPSSSGDIGDRIIISPTYLNKKIDLDEVSDLILQYSKQYNVLILVPSFQRADIWVKRGAKLINNQNLEDIVEELNASQQSLHVLVNRYNGIDLPKNACRMIVLDGVPINTGLREKGLETVIDNTSHVYHDKISLIEQGMGRGVRDNKDWCAIIIFDWELSNFIFIDGNEEYFSDATKAQFKLSKDVAEQIKSENAITSIRETLDMFFDRDEQWVSISREVLSSLKTNKNISIAPFYKLSKNAFNHAQLGNIDEAIDLQNDAVNMIDNSRLKGAFKERLARYYYTKDKEQAKIILKSAQMLNRNLIKPWQVENEQVIIPDVYENQAQSIIKRFNDKFFSKLNEHLANLVMHPDMSSNKFEEAWFFVGLALGCLSNRPEREFHNTTLDVLWKTSNDDYLLFSCKNRAISPTINKEYIDAMYGDLEWLKHKISPSANGINIIIYPKGKASKEAIVNDNCRILSEDNLNKFIYRIKSFYRELESSGDKSVIFVESLLNKYTLKIESFINEFTESIFQD